MSRALRCLLLVVALSTSSASATLVHFGLEIPFIEAPGLSPPPSNPSVAGEFGNFFIDLLERFGLSAGVYPVTLGKVHLGLRVDAMWHYDVDTDRTPSIVGYNHVGLAPSLLLDLSPALFVQGAFGLNRMAARVGPSSPFEVGTLLEASLGFRLGSGGRGVTLEGVFQNRTGLSQVRYGLIRLGSLF